MLISLWINDRDLTYFNPFWHGNVEIFWPMKSAELEENVIEKKKKKKMAEYFAFESADEDDHPLKSDPFEVQKRWKLQKNIRAD